METERCSTARCRDAVTMTYLGKLLCVKCWNKLCIDDDAVDNFLDMSGGPIIVKDKPKKVETKMATKVKRKTKTKRVVVNVAPKPKRRVNVVNTGNTGTRLLGRTWNLSRWQMWRQLFSLNDAGKLKNFHGFKCKGERATDDEIHRWTRLEYPGIETQAFRDVAGVQFSRAYFNGNGSGATPENFKRYDAHGVPIKSLRGRGGTVAVTPVKTKKRKPRSLGVVCGNGGKRKKTRQPSYGHAYATGRASGCGA